MSSFYDAHFCLLIFAQDQWKESYTEKISKNTRDLFYQYTGHSNCDVCNTCPICRALVEMFDPMNPDEYIIVCDLCKALYKMMEEIKGQTDGMILFSHSFPLEIQSVTYLTKLLLQSDKIKKIYILEVVTEKNTQVSEVIEKIKKIRLKKSEFIKLLDSNEFKDKVLYEISKDSYF
ncbi:MAG: hypothetical protein WED07_10590 [Candidatus Freyarchaeum deiterrae]